MANELSSAPLRILVVDDEPTMRRLFIGALRNEYPNAEIKEASDGASAIQELRRDALWKPHIAITDLFMEPMTGLQFTRMVRGGYEHIDRMLPIVLVTGDQSQDTITAAMHAGVDSILPKPLSPRQLLDRVGHLVRKDQSFVEIKEAFGAGPNGVYFGPLTRYARDHLIKNRSHHLIHRPSRLAS